MSESDSPWLAPARARRDSVSISPEADIATVGEKLEATGDGALAICDERGCLLGLLTDGDFRRAILHRTDMSQACLTIANGEPLKASESASRDEVIALLDSGRSFPVNQLPLVDEAGMFVGLVLRRDLSAKPQLAMQAVVMAGGFGKRLRPLTEDTPKPMLPVGDQPLLERIINRLSRSGIGNVNVTTHHSPEKIVDHFGDGTDFGVKLSYVNEEQPLGTAGALGLIAKTETPLLVMNGDILTDIDFEAMLAFHREHSADLTVAVRQYDFKVPYGVMDCEGHEVRKVSEKPVHVFLVNAGIYLIEPELHADIPTDQRMDMTEFIELNIAKGRRVVSFPITEYWLDIGQREDFERANEDVRSGAVRD